jgi:Galactose oxidase, central domain
MIAALGAALFCWLATFGAGCGPGLGAVRITPTTATTPTGTPTPGQLSGDVLIAGGIDAADNAVATAEVYDPVTQTFSNTGSMKTARAFHTATLLPNGTVLLVGGQNAANTPLDSAEFYNESNEKFHATTGTMVAARTRHAATALPSGQVLITGGIGSNGVPLGTAELYDPSTGKFTATSHNMIFKRAGHTATLLGSGLVLIAGGFSDASQTLVQDTAELYDPNTQTFTAIANLMRDNRYYHQALFFNGGTLSGQVLLAGGHDTSVVTATAELYDPIANAFNTAGVMTISRMQFASAIISGGMVLLCGGMTNAGIVTQTAEVYTPGGTFGPTGNMTDSRRYHTATVLTSGALAGLVLVVGGQSSTTIASTVNTAELYDPNLGSFTATDSMVNGRFGHTAAILP